MTTSTLPPPPLSLSLCFCCCCLDLGPFLYFYEEETFLWHRKLKSPVVMKVLPRKRSASRLNWLLDQAGLFAAISWWNTPSYHESIDLEAIREHAELIAWPIGPLALIFLWAALFLKNSITVAFCGRCLPSSSWASPRPGRLRGVWRDRGPNDIFAHYFP